ncbi:unnamed protein product [Closterium sp. NIES-53]
MASPNVLTFDAKGHAVDFDVWWTTRDVVARLAVRSHLPSAADVWGPARISGQGRECYFLLVVDDYMRYTTVFPLRSKGQVVDVLIPWIRAVRLQLRERFRADLPILRLHSVRGGEFSSDLLQEFCRGEGILQSFTLPDSPQQNGIAERHIGLVMEVAHTSMIHVAAPHFLWSFAVRYAAHQLNLWPRVSLLETSPRLRWTGKVGDVSVFRFYHPTLRHVFPSQDVMFDESVPFYRLFPYRSAPPPPPPLFLGPDPLPGTAPVEVAVGSGAAPGAASGGAELGGAEPGGAESEGAGAELGGAESGGAGSGGAEPWSAEPGGVEPAGVDLGGAEPEDVEPGGTASAGAKSRGAESRGQREQTGGHTEQREPASRPASPVLTGRRVPRPRSPPVPGTHAMTLRPSSVSLRVPLPPPPESSLLAVPNLESDRARAASPTDSRLLATVVTDPSFESAAASALVAELVDFAAACRLDYATGLVAESESVKPPSVEGECALGTEVLEDRQEDFECLVAAVPRFASMLLAPEGDPDALDIPTPRSYAKAITGPYSSQWQAAMDADMASWKSTSSSPGVDYFQTFSPTPKMTTLRVLLHIAAQQDYELHSLDFSTAFLQGSLHEEIWLRRPPGFTGSIRAGTQCSLQRPVYGLRQAPRERDTPALTWVLQRFGFQFSSPQPTPLFTGHSLSAPPSDESVEPSGQYPEPVGCLITSGMGLVLGGRGPVVLTGHAEASWVDDSATQRSL